MPFYLKLMHLFHVGQLMRGSFFPFLFLSSGSFFIFFPFFLFWRHSGGRGGGGGGRGGGTGKKVTSTFKSLVFFFLLLLSLGSCCGVNITPYIPLSSLTYKKCKHYDNLAISHYRSDV